MNDLVALVKRLVPSAIKDPIKEHLRIRHFAKALASFRQLQRDQVPSKQLLEELVFAWGNEGYSAQHEYLLELVRTSRQIDGPIIECGSGLSTMLVGVEAQRRALSHYALENHPGWARRMRRELTAAAITSVVVCETPLRNYGKYTWYDVSEANLPTSFAMAICDGPPGDSPESRYGLMPVLGDRLGPGCLVMVDDFIREREQTIVCRWAKETGASITRLGIEKPFAVLRMP
jgi:hypothetical protein